MHCCRWCVRPAKWKFDTALRVQSGLYCTHCYQKHYALHGQHGYFGFNCVHCSTIQFPHVLILRMIYHHLTTLSMHMYIPTSCAWTHCMFMYECRSARWMLYAHIRPRITEYKQADRADVHHRFMLPHLVCIHAPLRHQRSHWVRTPITQHRGPRSADMRRCRND
jgi:hypothetical protein